MLPKWKRRWKKDYNVCKMKLRVRLWKPKATTSQEILRRNEIVEQRRKPKTKWEWNDRNETKTHIANIKCKDPHFKILHNYISHIKQYLRVSNRLELFQKIVYWIYLVLENEHTHTNKTNKQRMRKGRKTQSKMILCRKLTLFVMDENEIISIVFSN